MHLFYQPEHETLTSPGR